MPDLTLDTLRRDLEAYGYHLADEDYQNAVGLVDEVDTASVHARYAHVRTTDALDLVKRALATATDAEDARRLRHLELDIFGAILADHFAEEVDALVAEESKATATVDDVTLRWREIGDRIRNEDDRARRRRWKAASDDIARRFLPRGESLETRSRALTREMGYPDDATLWEYEHRIPLADLDARMQRVLSETEDAYVHAFADRMERDEGLGLDHVEGHDVAHAMRVKRFDAHFPKDALVPAFKHFTSGLGFDLDAMGNVTVDLTERPAKDARAFTLPARVPQDVRLATKPAGGVDDWQALFHESGHLLHFAHTRADLPYEFRHFGDDGVTESFAFLFEHLFENPAFLADVAPTLQGDALRDYLRHCGLAKLMSLRYYAAALHYDIWAATAELEEMPARYVATLTDALKYPANPLSYLDTDGFGGVWYLRAWMLEAAHRDYLTRTFGEKWWTHPDVADHLRRLFADGTRPTCEDVAREIGRELDIAPVIADAERLLRA